jgi:peptidyl-prolyl cis-trans isomerase D
MLEAIRKRAGSLVVKILFMVLTLSFVIWGIADVFRPGGGTDWAAEVGGEKIPASVFQTEYRSTLQRLGRTLGRPIDAEQAQALGLPRSVLDRLIDGVLIDRAARELGLVVGDEAVREAIKANTQFRNELGQFDPQIFRAALAQAGFTEDRFVDLLRRELAREQIITSIAEGVTVPKVMLDSIERWHGERRTAELVYVPDTAFAAGEPDDATLRQFHQDYPGLFTAPEYRKVTAVILSVDELAKGIAVDDAKLQTAYQDRQAEFTRPERRTFRQMVFGDEAQAARAREALARGESFTDVAAGAGQPDAAGAKIGPVTREQLPGDLAIAVFQISPGMVSNPVESSLGWHVIEVTGVEPGSVQTFAEVKDQLADELKREQAVDVLVELGEKLEDILGRGATLAEAAQELNVPVRTWETLDARGRDASGAVVEGLPPQLVETAFRTAAQTSSDLIEADAGTYFVLHVDAVTPTLVRPLEAVRAQAADAWRARQRNDQARQKAEELAQRIREGGDLAALAKAQNLKAITTAPFTRTGVGAGEDVPRALVATVFEAQSGEVLVVPLDDGYAVARIGPVLPAVADAGADTAARSELDEALKGDLLTQYALGLRQRWPVEINPRVFEQAL